MLQAEKKQTISFPKEISRNKHNLPISDRLKIARNLKGLSQAKVIAELKRRGVKCGLSTLQGYEASEDCDHHRYPSITMLLALAELYDCSIDYIFGRVESVSLPSKKRKAKAN